MRNPAEFLREAEVQRFLVFQALVVGIIASSLVFPLMLLWIGYGLVHVVLGESASLDYAVLAIDCMNVAVGFLSFYGLGKSTGEGKAISALVMRSLPLYGQFISDVAWRALWQLQAAPFLWEKTPHKPSEVLPAMTSVRPVINTIRGTRGPSR